MATVTRVAHNPRHSILLSPTASWPDSYASSSSSSSTDPSASSASSDSSHTSNSASTPTPAHPKSPLSPPSARRIRFAPLPDPRRSVLITDDGDELPLPDPSSPTDAPTATTPLDLDSAGVDSSSIGSSSSASQRNSYSTDPSSVPSTPGTATPASVYTSKDNPTVPASPSSYIAPALPAVPADSAAAATKNKGASWPKARGLSILRPFKKTSGSSSSSSHTLTPTSSLEPRPSSSRGGVTKEEILTLGTIHFFRPSSRDSRQDLGNESDPGVGSGGGGGGGWGLTRWTSAGSAATSNSFGSPLARVQSTQSYTSKSKSKSTPPSSFVQPSPSRSKPQTQQANKFNRHKGTRMLNGRVYGGPKKNANPFANARDEETEFVEWGYGGMGSVKGAKSAGVSGAGWEKLQGGAVTTAEDDDDGSGIGWARRRKEQREREKKEREEREKAEAEAASEAVAAVAEEPKVTPSAEPQPDTPDEESAAAAAISPLFRSPTSTGPSTPSTAGAEGQHYLHAINVPAVLPKHRRSNSRDFNHSALSLAQSSHSADEAPLNAGTPLQEVKEESKIPEDDDEESDSESEEDSTGHAGEDEDDDEDEDEDEADEARRKTALGAGVEKISRHKEASSSAQEHAVETEEP